MGMGLKSEIESLLKSVDTDFDPPLSTRISIPEYSEKIHKHATIFSIHQCEELLAFVALYCNDLGNSTAYVTMVGVSRNHRGIGLASTLIESSIQFLRTRGFKSVRLEVDKSNRNAIKLYDRLGFEKVEQNETSAFMELRLEKKRPNIISPRKRRKVALGI